MEAAKVFISHSHEEESVAIDIQRKLEQRGIKAWAYEYSLRFGDIIVHQIKRHIIECDHVLVILSDHSRRSQWVGRELCLARKLQERRGRECPWIIGLRCDSPCESFSFDLLDFETSRRTGETHDFTQSRWFNLSSKGQSDSVECLADTLQPKVTFITDTDGEEGELLRKSFKCYEALFPDVAMRDDPADIEVWLDEARHAAANNDPWREIWSVLHIGKEVIGIAYVSTHLDHPWSFGSYFGVTRTWRGKRRAERFLEEVIGRLRAISPTTKGILFEIETIDLRLLAEVADRSKVGGQADQEAVIRNLRFLRRLNLYQSYKALAIIGADSLPLPYWQPAMDEPLDTQREKLLILMVRLLEGVEPEDIQLKDILYFIYDVFYGDAYGGAGAINIRGYRSYLAQVKARVESGAQHGWCAGPIEIPRKIRGLLIRAEQEEGLSERLQL